MAMVLVILLAASSAVGQEKVVRDWPGEIDRGALLARQGKFRDAIVTWLELLEAAPPKEHLPTIHQYLGIAYMELKAFPEAWHHMRTYAGLGNEQDKEAQADLDKVEKGLLKSHVKVSIICNPEGAALYLSDKAEGAVYACPLEWWFPHGTHPVYAVKQGHEPASAELAVALNGRTEFSLVLIPVAPAVGTLIIEGNEPAAQVFLNGGKEGALPFSRSLKPGIYEVRIEMPGKKEWAGRATIEAGKTNRQIPTFEEAVATVVHPKVDKPVPAAADPGKILTTKAKSKRGKAAWKWVALGTGLVTVAVGGILHAAAWNDEVDLYNRALKEKWPQSQYDSEFEDQIRPRVTASYVLYAVGGAATAAGLVGLLVETVRGNKKRQSAQLLPTVGPGTAVLVLDMSF
jgi:hypothetical protein